MDNRMKKKTRFRIFPEQRMYSGFPWPVWIVGWLAIYKGTIWMATSPNISNEILEILGYKYIFFMIPNIVFGIGVWHFKKWAVIGLIALCAGDILFFLFFPSTLSSFYLDKTSALSMILTMLLAVINGPVGDILILMASPVLLKSSRQEMNYTYGFSSKE